MSREGYSGASGNVDLQKMRETFYQMSIQFLGWSKILAAFLYVTLFSFTLKTSLPCTNRSVILTLQAFLVMATVVTVIYGFLVCSGAYNENRKLIHYSVPCCLILGMIDLFIGILGIFTYCSGSYETSNFVLMLVYIFILLQLWWIACYDYPHIMLYRDLLGGSQGKGRTPTQSVHVAQIEQTVTQPSSHSTRAPQIIQTVQISEIITTPKAVYSTQIEKELGLNKAENILALQSEQSSKLKTQTTTPLRMPQRAKTEIIPQKQRLPAGQKAYVPLTETMMQTDLIDQTEITQQTSWWAKQMIQMEKPSMTEQMPSEAEQMTKTQRLQTPQNLQQSGNALRLKNSSHTPQVSQGQQTIQTHSSSSTPTPQTPETTTSSETQQSLPSQADNVSSNSQERSQIKDLLYKVITSKVIKARVGPQCNSCPDIHCICDD